MSKKLFILSTKAGKKEFKDFKDKIVETYRKHNRSDEVEIVMTEYKDHAKDAAREFSKDNNLEKIVIVCGGDGTLGEVSNVLVNTDTAISVIPMGTANDFSKNFDFKNFSLENTFDPIVSPIDLIKVNESYCINALSLGFDTYILKKTYDILEKNPNLGHKAFYLAVLKSLKNIYYENLNLELNLVNGNTININKELIISALCNGSFYGSGFNPAPNGKIDDGVLHLVTADNMPLWKLIPLIVKYRFGKHLGNKGITEYLVKSGKIKSDKKLIANIDGEIFESNEIDFKVVEKAIKWAYFKTE